MEEWQKKCHQQELKSDRLREQLSRTERELYGLLQRKYQIMRGSTGGSKTQTNPKAVYDSDKKDEISLPADDASLTSHHVCYI